MPLQHLIMNYALMYYFIIGCNRVVLCSMKQLMRKFRIPVSDVVVIPDIVTPPSTATRAWFDNLTREFVRKDDAAVDNSSGCVNLYCIA